MTSTAEHTERSEGYDYESWKAQADEARRLCDAAPHEEGVLAVYAPSESIPPPTDVPKDDPHVEEFIRREAQFERVSVVEMRARIEQQGFGAYVLDGLRARRLRFTEAWNALGTSFIEVLALAHSNGAMEISDDLRGMIFGKQDGLVAEIRQDPDLVIREIAFTPSFDPDHATPQYAEIGYDPNVRNAPVVICQHGGYPGSRMMEVPKVRELAAQGFFAIAVSKRGRDGSAGEADGWCRETADIVDALDHCAAEYADYLDPTNVTIRGMSGGGLDTIAALVRYPDRFRIGVVFMGYADVESCYAQAVGPAGDQVLELAPEQAPMIHSMRRLAFDVGRGLPDESDRVMARNYTLAYANNLYTQTHFIWDETEPTASSGVPGGPSMDGWFEGFRAAAQRMSTNNVHLHRSQRGDAVRFPHWFGPDIDYVDRFYVADALSGRFPAPRLAPAGFLTVLGFLKTTPFEVVLGDGSGAVARLEYEIGVERGFFRFRRLSSDPAITGVLRFRNTRGRRLVARVDGRVVTGPATDEWLEVPIGLDDTVIIDRS